MMSDGAIRAVAEITNPTGLHARPAVKMTKLAKSFAARIDLAFDAAGPWIDAKSVVKVMALKAPQGARLYFTAIGADADKAVAELVNLVQRDFDEGPHAAGASGQGHGG